MHEFPPKESLHIPDQNTLPPLVLSQSAASFSVPESAVGEKWQSIGGVEDTRFHGSESRRSRGAALQSRWQHAGTGSTGRAPCTVRQRPSGLRSRSAAAESRICATWSST